MPYAPSGSNRNKPPPQTINLPETRLIWRERRGKYAIKILIKHAHSWK
jgi:hypothetical protein